MKKKGWKPSNLKASVEGERERERIKNAGEWWMNTTRKEGEERR